YMAPPRIATVLSINFCASGESPAAITVPAPSLPTGNDWSTRPAIVRMMFGAMFAVTRVFAPLPDDFAVPKSAAPSSKPRSDGLIGDASTRTTTSSGFGAGVGVSTKDNSNTPSFFTIERSCKPLFGYEFAMAILPRDDG